MKCPYDPRHENTTKPEKNGYRYYAKCGVCGRKSIAIIHYIKDKGNFYELSRIGALTLTDKKKVRTIRLSDSEMRSIEQGRLRLIVSNNRITITV